MAAVIWEKGMHTFSGCVIYLITVMATCYRFCFALLSVGAYNLSPRVKGHFCVLTLIVASVLAEMKLVLRVFYSRWNAASAPLLRFYHCPSPLLSFSILGIMQVLCNILRINQSKQNPMPYYPWQEESGFHNPDSFVMLSSCVTNFIIFFF